MTIHQMSPSFRRARHEARQARRHGYRLPHGHPYRTLPTWVPFALAKVIARIIG
ncbi:MAG TPA: hypothetical protein VNX29_13670 [Kaistia sp.]|nr:hypothetical protein [Kaistia sp.]